MIRQRRAGDIAECYADVFLAKEKLGFRAQDGISDMVKDSYQFYVKNK